MTAVAVLVLVGLAVFPALPAVVRWRRGPSVAVDIGAAVVVVVVAAIAALSAAIAGPASGPGTLIGACAAVIAAVTGGGSLVRVTLVAGGVLRVNADPESDDEQTPLRGGRVIGYLERVAVTATVLTGWPEGLAVILAVKSVARFPDLRAPHASEQFIMGTFASVLWALAMAGIAHLIAI